MLTETAPEAPAYANPLADPGSAFDASLEARRVGQTPSVVRLDLETLLGCKPGKKPQKPVVVLELSARHPWDDAGLIDGYHVGRWDSSTDTIYMSPIVQTGPTIGEWDGTVLYGKFTAPAAGTYQIVATFYGWQITMRLSSPAAPALATSVENAPTTVSTQVTLAAGQKTWFNLNCTGLYLGFLQKIQVVTV
jgi:hypothetical protein